MTKTANDVKDTIITAMPITIMPKYKGKKTHD